MIDRAHCVCLDVEGMRMSRVLSFVGSSHIASHHHQHAERERESQLHIQIKHPLDSGSADVLVTSGLTTLGLDSLGIVEVRSPMHA
jgi:glutamate 5-kinase